MVSFTFSLIFNLTLFLCLGLFAAAEFVPAKKNVIAAWAAIVEGIVFLELGWVFYNFNWGAIPAEIQAWLPLESIPPLYMAAFPVAGSFFAFFMAYKRYTGKPL